MVVKKFHVIRIYNIDHLVFWFRTSGIFCCRVNMQSFQSHKRGLSVSFEQSITAHIDRKDVHTRNQMRQKQLYLMLIE